MKILTVTSSNFEMVLPLVAAYQRFYRTEPNEDRNRSHFARFLNDDSEGIMFLATEEERAIGFATIYFIYSSVRVRQECLMNDLYVAPETRGKGLGRALIDHCAGYARERGYESLTWRTEPTNHTAQRVYNATGAARSEWYEYVLPV